MGTHNLAIKLLENYVYTWVVFKKFVKNRYETDRKAILL